MAGTLRVSVVGVRVFIMLTVKEKMTLDLQRTQFRYAGSLDTWIRELFSEHTASYFQRLNWLVDRPEAEAYAPDVVHRQKRVREARRLHRSARSRLSA